MTPAQERALHLAAVRGRAALYDYVKRAEKTGFSGSECRHAVEDAIRQTLARSRAWASRFVERQRVVVDEHGIRRFRRNMIVDHLLTVASRHGADLNVLARMDFTDEDRCQLAQLIGYSESGYHDLSYVRRFEHGERDE